MWWLVCVCHHHVFVNFVQLIRAFFAQKTLLRCILSCKNNLSLSFQHFQQLLFPRLQIHLIKFIPFSRRGNEIVQAAGKTFHDMLRMRLTPEFSTFEPKRSEAFIVNERRISGRNMPMKIDWTITSVFLTGTILWRWNCRRFLCKNVRLLWNFPIVL